MPAKQKKTAKRRKKGWSDGGEVEERRAEEMVRRTEDSVYSIGRWRVLTEQTQQRRRAMQRWWRQKRELVVESREQKCV